MTITVIAGNERAERGCGAGSDRGGRRNGDPALAQASDPEGETFSFAWSAPDGITLTAADTATASFSAPQELAADQNPGVDPGANRCQRQCLCCDTA